MMDGSGVMEKRRDCERCGWRARPGHICTRFWGIPRTFWGISRSGFKGAGGLRHTGWALHWKWRGDVHKLLWSPSLGTHINVSRRGRQEQRERDEYERMFAGEEAA